MYRGLRAYQLPTYILQYVKITILLTSYVFLCKNKLGLGSNMLCITSQLTFDPHVEDMCSVPYAKTGLP